MEETQKALVAFIDILGFKNMVTDYFSGKNKESLLTLENTLKASEVHAITFAKNVLKQYKIEVIFKQFSDCVSISMPISEKNESQLLGSISVFIGIVRFYQYILLDNSIMVRGGISIGPHMESTNMIFSEALIKSYKLETEKAIYPRILIDKTIITTINKLLDDMPHIYNDFYKRCGCCLIRDWDDEIFISSFGLISESQNQYKKNDEEMKQLLSYHPMLMGETEINVVGIRENINKLTDNEKVEEWLKIIDQYLIQSPTAKTEIILKYKWLKQFMRWFLNNEDSDIKFQNYYKSPKESI